MRVPSFSTSGEFVETRIVSEATQELPPGAYSIWLSPRPRSPPSPGQRASVSASPSTGQPSDSMLRLKEVQEVCRALAWAASQCASHSQNQTQWQRRPKGRRSHALRVAPVHSNACADVLVRVPLGPRLPAAGGGRRPVAASGTRRGPLAQTRWTPRDRAHTAARRRRKTAVPALG